MEKLRRGDGCDVHADARRATPAKKKALADLGIARLFQSRTHAFCAEYLVSETGPVPFGGRQAEFDRLDAWLLNEEAPPRLLLAAPAGRGKSALLVRWIDDRQKGLFDQDGWHVAFMPISIRVGTNRPEVFYEGLARRLAEITNEQMPPDALSHVDGLHFFVRDQMERIADTRQRVLVVLDGLDEALGEFDPEVLPTTLPPTLRVLVSARWQVGDTGSSGWLSRLRWDRRVRADTLELDRLDRTRIADVLIALGAPVDTLTKDTAIVDRLLLLTEGEPILVRYYAEDLWDLGTHRPSITRADLDTLTPGFDSYFQRWFDYQERAWRDEGFEDSRTADAVLSVLAFALGPLEEDDLLALLERLQRLPVTTAADRLLKPLRRFVLGTGKSGAGFVLSHPRIADYLREKRFSARAGDLRRSFADWGIDHRRRLNEGRLRPEDASPYALQFLARHLEETNARPEDFTPMAEDGWRRAWEFLEGSQRGWSADLRSALSMLTRKMELGTIAGAWRCGLALSSVKSLGHTMPGALIVRAVQHNVISPKQGQHLAELISADESSSATLAELALQVSSDAVRRELMLMALNSASSARDERVRAVALERVTAVLLDPSRELNLDIGEIVEVAWSAADTLNQPWFRLFARANLISHRSDDERQRAIESAIDQATSEAPHGRDTMAPAGALAKEVLTVLSIAAVDDNIITRFLTNVPNDQCESVSRSVKRARDVHVRSALCARLGRYYEEESRIRLLNDTLDSALEVDSVFELWRSQAVVELLPHLAPDRRALAAAEVLASARTEARSGLLFDSLVTALPYLPSDALIEIHALAHAIVKRGARLGALVSLAPHLASEQRGAIWSEALDLALAIKNKWERERALALVASHLPPEFASRAFEKVKSFRDIALRARMLAAITPMLPLDIIPRAHRLAMSMKSYEGWRLILALLPRLPLSQRDQACAALLDAERIIADVDERSELLVAITPHLSGAQLDEVARQAVGLLYFGECGVRALDAVASRLSIEQKVELLQHVSRLRATERTAGLRALAPWLPPSSLSEALAAGKTIGDGDERGLAQTALAIELSRVEGAGVFRDLLGSTAATRDQTIGPRALALLSPHLPPELLKDAITMVTSMGDDEVKVSFLVAVAPSLPEELMIDALAMVKSIRTPAAHTPAFLTLLPFVPDRLFPTALATVWENGKGFSDRPIWTALMARMPRDLAQAALQVANEIPRGGFIKYRSTRRSSSVVLDGLRRGLYRGYEGGRFAILAGSLPVLPEAQRTTVLEMVRALEDEETRAVALCDLAINWTPPEREAILAEAFEAVSALEENSRRQALEDLAPHLPPALVERAFHQALTSDLEFHRAAIIATLVPFLSEQLLLHSLELADELTADSRTILLVRLLKRLPLERSAAVHAAFRRELVAAITGSDPEPFRYRSLASIAEFLSASDLDEVLARADATEDENVRLRAVQAVAALGSVDAAARALTVASGIKDDTRRLEALMILASHAPPKLRRDLMRAMLDIVPVVRRDHAMAAVTACSGIVAALGGGAALRELTRAVQDVGNWYP